LRIDRRLGHASTSREGDGVEAYGHEAERSTHLGGP